jgi:ATP-binding cassette subfamily C protein CydD
VRQATPEKKQTALATRAQVRRYLNTRLWQQERGALLGCVALRVVAGVCAVGSALSLVVLLLSLRGAALPPPFAQSVAQLGGAAVGLAAFAFFLVVRALLARLADNMGALLSARFRATLRDELYACFIALGPVHLARAGETGALTTAMIDEVEALEGYAGRYLPLHYSALIVPPALLILVAWLDPVSAVILLGAALILPLGLAGAGILAAKASLKKFGALRQLGGTFFDRLRHLPTLKAYGAERFAADQLAEQAQLLRLQTMRVLRRAFLSTLVIELCAMLSFALVAGHLFLHPLGHDAGGVLAGLLIVLLVPEFFVPIRALAASYHDRAMAYGAAPHLMQLLSLQPPFAQRSPSLSLTDETAEGGQKPQAAPTLEFKGVSYTYPERVVPALRDVSFTVPAGQVTALVGPSGAGKSTVLHLLSGFLRPDSGHIEVNGQPFLPHQQRHFTTLLRQQAYLFTGSIADNLRLAAPEASSAEMLQALEQVELKSWVLSLPQGLETAVGVNGFGLSGGQARRLALARVYLRNAPVVLLDEPTAGLDKATTEEVLHSLRKLAASGRYTIVLVTHDPQVMAIATHRCSLSPPEVELVQEGAAS